MRLSRRIFLFILAAASVLSLSSCMGKKVVTLKAQDYFPTDISIYSSEGKQVKVNDIKNTYKVIFYLDSSSRDCIQRLSSIKKIMEVYNFKNISYLIFWEDQIPVNTIKSAGIPLENNYTYNQRVSLSSSKPTGFLLNQNNQILQITGYSYIDLLNNLYNYEKQANMLTKINQFVWKDAFGNQSNRVDSKKPTLVMLVASDCKLCRENEQEIQSNGGKLQNKFNVITVRPDFDTQQTYDQNPVTDDSLVYFTVYQETFKVNNYPLYLILDQNKNVEKYFTDIKNLLQYTDSI